MNVIQLSPHVFKCEFAIKSIVPIPVNIWFVKYHDDVYIIDTGIEEFVSSQMKIAASIGVPKAVLLTHGHGDHINGAARWRKEFKIPIYAHPQELIYINGEEPYPNKDTIENTGVANMVQPLTSETLAHLPMQFYLTPGHSPGHVIYHHEEDNILLAGDLFITSKDDLHPPVKRFSVDMNQNIKSGAIIDEIKPKLISSSHGQDIFYHDDLYKKYVFWYGN